MLWTIGFATDEILTLIAGLSEAKGNLLKHNARLVSVCCTTGAGSVRTIPAVPWHPDCHGTDRGLRAELGAASPGLNSVGVSDVGIGLCVLDLRTGSFRCQVLLPSVGSLPRRPCLTYTACARRRNQLSKGTVRRIIIENPDQEPLSPFLRGGNFCPGNNVIYEKTIRKYELLNPHQEKQYQFSHHCQIPQQADQCHAAPQSEQSQVTHQCQQTQTSSPCEITPVCVSNDCRGNTVRRVTVQPCEPENNNQLDCRYFGELLAELNRKTNDLYSCLLQHVEKIGGRNYDIEFTSQTEDIEDLIPKGLSEATKQQIRYLLQMRVTSDKSLRLVLSTFKNLREELCHLQDDLGKLEMDTVLLKKDLAFKDSQVKEYETMLASLRENNRQQQQGLRESTAKCRSLEEQLLSLRLSEGEKDCQLKELEYGKRALEQEIQSLRLQSCSNPTLQTTTDELSSRYVEMINNLREDKDREIRSLRSQLCQFQQDISRREGSNSDLQIKLNELTSMLEEKDAFIKQQQEDLFRLKHEKLSGSQSPGVTAIITKKYRNQYPILGLLSDDYKVTSPVNKSQTIVIERTGEIWKHLHIPEAYTERAVTNPGNAEERRLLKE
ncbi:protein POF1B [Antrostomus carolinensis]|uniref:protein POF1B n=1 Tax=Antrostomus carolinensis TaxID=279965 RepID=UPI0010A97D58|nr:protein POF1B [Antrostomus carolinensis]